MITARTSGWLPTAAAALAVWVLGARPNLAPGQVAAPRNSAAQRGTERSDPRASALFRSAAALQDRELFDLAASEWKALLEQFPDDPLVGKARHYRGVCLVRLDRFAEAEAEFATVITRHTHLDGALLEQAYANLGFAQYNRARAVKGAEREAAFDSAIATLGRQLEQFPEGKLAAEAHYFRAEASYARERLDAAVEGYRRVATEYRENPLRASALYGLGAAEQERGNMEQAGATFDEFLAEFPDHELAADVHCRRGDTFVAQKQFSDAASHYLVAARATDDADADRARRAVIDVAQAAYSEGEHRSAIDIVDRFIDRFPKGRHLDEAYLLRGTWRAAEGEALSALSDFARVAEYWPDSPIAPLALLRQAELEQSRAEYHAAQIALGRFLVNYREHAQVRRAHLLRASVRYELGLFVDAIDDIDAAIGIDPSVYDDQSLDGLFLRGICEARLQRNEEAIETFHNILEYDPSYTQGDRVLYEMAGAFGALGERKKAARTYRRLVGEFQPSSLAADAHYRIGQWQFDKGDFAGAAENFQRGWERAQQASLKERAIHQLGWCRFSLGQFQEAEHAFESQLAQYPSGTTAMDARLMAAECKFRQHRYGDSLAAFSASLESTTARRELVEMGLLHGAKSAASCDQCSQALAFLDRYLREFPESGRGSEVRVERGIALYHLEQLEEAREAFESVVDSVDRDELELRARARFMLGETHFAQKQYDDAVRTFFQVVYGSGEAPPAAARHWQAESLFEAARCLEQTERFGSAEKLYLELLERFPESEKARHARIALQQLKTRLR